VFSFSNLQALTRTTTGLSTNNDFTDLDTLLNTSAHNDSIRWLWGNGVNNPTATTAFNISGREIGNVPVVNSTNSSDFVTGILWDVADDVSSNLQYDTADHEDVVLLTRINPGKTGTYGVYDYEIRVPAPLRSYKTGSDTIIFYYEFT
jgi:hypothetical protein